MIADRLKPAAAHSFWASTELMNLADKKLDLLVLSREQGTAPPT